jgi:hypothetical protein
MIKTKSQILLEGRYDSFTRQIVNDIMYYLKYSEDYVDESINVDLPEESEFYEHKIGLKINLELIISRVDGTILYGDKELPYYVKSYIAEDDFMVIEITIDNRTGREYYQEIYYKLMEDVRHEIEHYVQYLGITDERFKEKPKPMGSSNYETTYEHHSDPSEVEALVRGFYRRAKSEKKPIDVVMWSVLNDEISYNNLTKQEAKNLFDLWLKYSRRNLPDAIYSKNL